MAYHTLRLLDQLNQLLTCGDLDLLKNKEECKSMRKGEWGNFDQFEKTFQNRMNDIEEVARKSPIAPNPQKAKLHNLLMDCIEHEYGSEEKATHVMTDYVSAKDVMEKLDTIDKKLSLI